MSSAAAAVPAVAAAASAADVHEVLTRPLSLVQRLLSRAATAAPGAAAASSDEHTPLSPAQVRSLHEHLTAAGSWGVEAELERVLGLRMPRSHPSNQLASIPSLNALQSLSSASARDAALVQHFRPGQLVRFRGMVQETLQPEYFNGIVQQRVGEHKQGDGSEPQPYTTSSLRTGKYRDALEADSTGIEGHEVLMERVTVNVVPVPGESSWVAPAIAQLEKQSGNQQPQQQLLQQQQPVATSGASAKKKRALDQSAEQEQGSSAMSDEHPASAAAASSSAAAAVASDEDVTASTPKKGKVEGAAAASSSASSSSGAAAAGTLPADEHGLEVLVTVYDSLARTPALAAPTAAAASAAGAAGAQARPLHAVKVGEVYEFLGVLSVAPDLKALLEGAAMSDDADFGGSGGLGDELWGPRRRQALRMHALTAVPLVGGEPFVADAVAEPATFATQRAELTQVLPAVRSSLLAYLASVLGGDELSAEVLLQFLLQRLHGRGAAGSGGRGLLGKLVVNMVLPASPADRPAAAPTAAQRIFSALESLLPVVSRREMSIPALNARSWQPSKAVGGDDESLHSGLLQLPSPSVLMLDESGLSAGTLSSQGITNLRVLSKLVSQAVLEYDFRFQTLDFPVECAVLLLSTASRALLAQDGQHAIDVTIKLQPSQAHGGIDAFYPPASASNAQAAPVPTPTQEQLNVWRAYLLMSRQNQFTIADQMSKSIEQKYLSLRQARPTVTNESTLHLLLNLARLHCLSHGETTLASEQRWSEVSDLFERLYQRGAAQA